MNKSNEVEEIKKLFANRDYKAVWFLMKDRTDLKKLLLSEYCISGIYNSDIDPVRLDLMVYKISKFFFESDYSSLVLKHIYEILISELCIKDNDFWNCYFRNIIDSEKKGLAVEERERLAGIGFASLLLYYTRVKERYVEKGNLHIFCLHAHASSHLFNFIVAEQYSKAADFLSYFIYTPGSINQIMNQVEMSVKNSGSVFYVPLFKFYKCIILEKDELFSKEHQEYFARQCISSNAILKKTLESMNNGSMDEMEQKNLFEYVEQMQKLLSGDTLKVNMKLVENHPKLKERKDILKLKDLTNNNNHKEVVQFIEKEYPQSGKTPKSVKSFYENSVINLYQASGKIHWVTNGLKWNPSSEKLKKILID